MFLNLITCPCRFRRYKEELRLLYAIFKSYHGVCPLFQSFFCFNDYYYPSKLVRSDYSTFSWGPIFFHFSIPPDYCKIGKKCTLYVVIWRYSQFPFFVFLFLFIFSLFHLTSFSFSSWGRAMRPEDDFIFFLELTGISQKWSIVCAVVFWLEYTDWTRWGVELTPSLQQIKYLFQHIL